MKTIEVSPLNSVLFISFLNRSHNPPTPVVWVCANREAYQESMRKLSEQEHIQITDFGHAHVEGA